MSPQSIATFCLEANLALSAALAALAFGAIGHTNADQNIYLQLISVLPPLSQVSWWHELHLPLPERSTAFDARNAQNQDRRAFEDLVSMVIVTSRKAGLQCQPCRDRPEAAAGASDREAGHLALPNVP